MILLFIIFKTLSIPNRKSWGPDIFRECLQSDGASGGRVCYQRGLPRLVYEVLLKLFDLHMWLWDKHCEIAKRCSEYTSSVVKVSSCSYQKTVLSLVRIWIVRIRFFELCHNLSFWVLSQFEFLSFVAIWTFEFCCYLSCHKRPLTPWDHGYSE